MKKQARYIFRWKLGEIEVEHTWAFSVDEVRERAIAICCPATMKRASKKRVWDYLSEHGEVVEQSTER